AQIGDLKPHPAYSGGRTHDGHAAERLRPSTLSHAATRHLIPNFAKSSPTKCGIRQLTPEPTTRFDHQLIQPRCIPKLLRHIGTTVCNAGFGRAARALNPTAAGGRGSALARWPRCSRSPDCRAGASATTTTPPTRPGNARGSPHAAGSVSTTPMVTPAFPAGS